MFSFFEWILNLGGYETVSDATIFVFPYIFCWTGLPLAGTRTSANQNRSPKIFSKKFESLSSLKFFYHYLFLPINAWRSRSSFWLGCKVKIGFYHFYIGKFCSKKKYYHENTWKVRNMVDEQSLKQLQQQ